MAKRLYSLQRIRDWCAYDVDDICALYHRQGLHPCTVQDWARKEGLCALDKKRPMLVMGSEVRRFLGARNAQNKCGTAFDEMFCMRCKQARKPKHKTIAFGRESFAVHASGICSSCSAKMNKSYKRDDISKLHRTFKVVGNSELYDSTAPPSNTHLSDRTKTKQMTLLDENSQQQNQREIS